MSINSCHFELIELREVEKMFRLRRQDIAVKEARYGSIFRLRGFTFFDAYQAIRDEHFNASSLHSMSDESASLKERLTAKEESDEISALSRQVGSTEKGQNKKQLPDSVWHGIKDSSNRSSAHKLAVANRFFPHAAQQYYDNEAPLAHEAMREQQERICKIYPPPGCVLGEGVGRLFYAPDGVKAISPPPPVEQADAVLKEAYNAVIIDAFSGYGFASIKKQSGLVVIGKPLIGNAHITIEITWADLKRSINGLTPRLLSSGQVVWLDGVDGGRIDWLRVSVALLDGKRISERWTFDNPIRAQPQIFATTSSLEVVLRGYALWYELTILPFEQAIRETLGAALEKRTQVEGASGEQDTLESEKVIEQPPEAPDLEPLLLDNFSAYMLLPVPWTQDRAEAFEDLPGMVRCFAAATRVTAIELEFEKVVGLLDPALVLPKDELRDELVKLSHQQALLLLYYAENHGWGWSVWDKGHRVGGFRQDIEESLTQQDGDLRALQRLGLEQTQVDQMVTAVQNISQADLHDEAWTDISAHLKLFLGVIGVGVSP